MRIEGDRGHRTRERLRCEVVKEREVCLQSKVRRDDYGLTEAKLLNRRINSVGSESSVCHWTIVRVNKNLIMKIEIEILRHDRKRNIWSKKFRVFTIRNMQ